MDCDDITLRITLNEGLSGIYVQLLLTNISCYPRNFRFGSSQIPLRISFHVRELTSELDNTPP